MRLTLALLLLAVPAQDHDWFPSYCCSGNGVTGDCQEIPSNSVKAILGGYGVVLVPGQHRRVTHPQSYTIPQSDVRSSPDGQYYICLYPNEETARCFFAPPPGV